MKCSKDILKNLIVILLGLFFLGCTFHALAIYINYFIYYVRCEINGPLTANNTCKDATDVTRPPTNFHVIPNCWRHPFGIEFLTSQVMSVIFMTVVYIYFIYLFSSFNFREAQKLVDNCRTPFPEDIDLEEFGREEEEEEEQERGAYLNNLKPTKEDTQLRRVEFVTV